MAEGSSHLSALQTLHLGDRNKLTTLPENFGQLSALQTLHFGGNNQLMALLESFGQLAVRIRILA